MLSGYGYKVNHYTIIRDIYAFIHAFYKQSDSAGNELNTDVVIWELYRVVPSRDKQ